MPGTTYNPTGASAPSGSWTNAINALPGDSNAYARNASGNNKLVLTFPAGSNVPGGATMLGVEVHLRANDSPSGGAIGEPDLIRTLKAQFSTNGGSSWTGIAMRTDDMTAGAGFADHSLGSPTEMWGITFVAADFNAGNLALAVWRPSDIDEAGGDRYLESAWLVVYYSTSGGTMPERISALQYCLIGKEVTPGTAVSLTRRLKAVKLRPQPRTETKEIAYHGDLVPGDHVVASEMGEASIDGHPTYDELGYILASLIGKPTSQLLVTGAYQHTFILRGRGVSDPQTYTAQFGDASSTLAEQTTYLLVKAMSMRSTRKTLDLSGSAISGKVSSATFASGTNEVQTLTMGTATSFKLRYEGAETAALTTAGLTSGALQTALQGLSTVGAGGFVVSGAGPFTITAGSALAGKPLPLIEVSFFTGGTTPTVTRTTPGGFLEDACVPVAPGSFNLYYDPTSATFGATKISKLISTEISIGNRFADQWFQDTSKPSFAVHGERPMDWMVKLTLEADATSQTLETDWRARTGKFMRLESVGEQIASTGYYYTLRLDAAVKVKLAGEYKEDDVVVSRDIELYPRHDSGWAQSVVITLINDKASY